MTAVEEVRNRGPKSAGRRLTPAGVPACGMEHAKYHQIQEDLRLPYRALRELIPEVMNAYHSLGTAAMQDGALPVTTKELIALAISITRECDGCIVAHARGCRTARA